MILVVCCKQFAIIFYVRTILFPNVNLIMWYEILSGRFCGDGPCLPPQVGRYLEHPVPRGRCHTNETYNYKYKIIFSLLTYINCNIQRKVIRRMRI